MVALLPCFLSPPSLLLCRRSKPILCLSSREVVRRPPLRLRAAPSGIGRPCLRVSALDPNHLFDIAVGVGLPCSVQGCGDVIYRSTLDPVLRMEEKVGITTQGASLIAAVLLYLYVTPGAGVGFVDYFFLAPLDKLLRRGMREEDFELSRKLGVGGFGTVYKAKALSRRKGETVVLKKAEEFGRAEEWMNLRVARSCRGTCADFIGAFPSNEVEESSSLWSTGQEYEPEEEPPLWLAWRFEGEMTLADAMKAKNFPFNMEEALVGRRGEGRAIEGGSEKEARARIVKVVMSQVLRCLRKIHASGIVHRDIKPENLIVAMDTRGGGGGRGKIKLIDLGAAADLRVGINYTPREILLDPRYAAPEQYIMSTQTPKAPPAPIALLLSPVLWQLNIPDRFDIYGVALVLLQVVFPDLRKDSALVSLRRMLAGNGGNVYVYRDFILKRGSKEMKEGCALLDAELGAGWDVIQKMLKENPDERVSASAALAHPFFAGLSIFDRILGGVDAAVSAGKSDVAPTWLKDGGKWLGFYMAKSGTKNVGGFTEAQLERLYARDRPPTAFEARDILGRAVTGVRQQARNTVRGLNLLKKKEGGGGGGGGGREGKGRGRRVEEDGGNTERTFVFFPWQK